jgi:transcriptional regulator with XRE-family HTH domain
LQQFSTGMVYLQTAMAKTKADSHLRALREGAGLSVRELARQLGIHHTNIVYWEKTGRVAKVELLPQLAEALGVTVEEVLGHPKPKRSPVAPGKLGQIFEAASRLPRRQQQKIIEFVEPFISSYERESRKKAKA